MKKPIALGVLGMLCIYTVSGQNTVDLVPTIHQTGRDISLKLAMAPRVALMNINSPSNDLSAYILKEIVVSLEERKSFTVITLIMVPHIGFNYLRAEGDSFLPV
jgi:hypothetical protein